MKELAAWIIIGLFITMFVANLTFSYADMEWGFVRSPETGICYELRSDIIGFGISQAMSPVADKYCEAEK